jgi:hypothetical protein
MDFELNDDILLAFRDSLNDIELQALNAFVETGDLCLVPFFWAKMPVYGEQLLPPVVEWAWHMWMGSLTAVQRLSVNAYFNQGDERLLLFVWGSLLEHVDERAQVAVPPRL